MMNEFTAAEQLALLLEDAADYRTAREALLRICQRNGHDTNALALLSRLDRQLTRLEDERTRLESKLHPLVQS